MLSLWSCTARAASAPLSVLFLDDAPPGSEKIVDPRYAERLAAAGIQYAQADYATPLQAEFIRRFNVFVFSRLPMDNAENDVFGWRMIPFRSNLERILGAVKQGAGLLIYADINDGGGLRTAGWNNLMRPLGATIAQACMLSTNYAAYRWKGNGDAWYAWTENLARHPAAEGVSRVYYPTACLRWDDGYTAPPLELDSAWTAIVRAMPGARIGRMEDQEWMCDAAPAEPPAWAAVRNLGQGRLAVVAMPAFYSHRMGYTTVTQANGWYGESCVGPIDGIVLEKGDGRVPSGTGRLLLNLYRWLAGESAKAGLGGYRTGEALATEAGPFDAFLADPPVRIDWDRREPLRSWGHVTVPFAYEGKPFGMEASDPRVTDEMHYYRALIGARTSLSDGHGTVAEFAQAARAAGYSLVCFTETFAALDARKWDGLVAECRAASAPDLFLLPGIDIEDFAGQRYLLINPNFFPRPSWLTPDGKRLAKVQLTSPLVIGNCLAIAHRAHGAPLSNERLKHFSALSLVTYRGDRMVDDSRQEYAWHVANADVPIPTVVHEVYSTQEVAVAARTGFQQLLPANTLADGVNYFRSGCIHYFKHPSRHLVSEGPVVEQWVLDPDGAELETGGGTRNQFRVWIKVRAAEPLAVVTLYDGFTPVRRWLPETNVFAVTADFQHAQQRHLYLVAQDRQGRQVITSNVRTVLPRHVFRCLDHQNWLGHIGIYYPGTRLSDQTDILLPVKGTEEGNGLLPASPGDCMAAKLQFPFASREVMLTEAILDEKYLTATFKEIGFDARPAYPSKPSSVYRGRFRRWNFTGFDAAAPYPTVLEYEVELRRDVEPRDPRGLFPAFAPLRSSTQAWFEKSGAVWIGALAPDARWDVPVGALAGGYIALSDGLRVDGKWLGLKPAQPDAVWLPAQTRFAARLLLTGGPYLNRNFDTRFDENPAAWLKALGCGRAPSFTLKFTRGKLERLVFLAETVAEGGVVAGVVARPAADIPYLLPMPVRGVNPRWPAGIWRPEEGLRYVGIFEDRAWPLLDVRRAGPFIAGNLLVADHPQIAMSVVCWTPSRIRLEIHNPTDEAITTRIRTPIPIPRYQSFDRRITVSAGSSTYLE
jgi:hypothetical protein